MAFSIIDGGNVVSKSMGNRESTINVSDLLSLNIVSTDDNFNDENKWDKILVLYTHASGQKKMIVHSLKNGQWKGILSFDSFTNVGAWQKRLIALFDKSNDSLTIGREHMVVIDEDLNVIG